MRTTAPARIAIIGGGAAGLAAAYRIRRAVDDGATNVEFDLFERAGYLGGKVAGEIVADPETGEPFVVDGGPDCYSSHKPAAMRLATLAGVGESRLPSNEARKGTFIWRDGVAHPLPEGFSMFVPTQIAPVFESELLTEVGKREIWRDLVEPARVWSEGERVDESLESFVLRRFGREVLDYLAEPFLGGVHASDPATMSLAATFPMYLDMERRSGSVIRATSLAVAARERARAGAPIDPSDTVFATFRGGMHELTDAIAQAVGSDHLHTGTGVARVLRSEGAYRVELENGESLSYDAVIVATESNHAAYLTAEVDEAISASLGAIPNISSATCTVAFRAEDVEVPERGFGTLIPAVENRALLAATYSSTKWANRAPDGRVLLRGFVGTPHNQAIMELPDDEIVAIVVDEMRAVLGVRDGAVPLFTRFYRWTLGMAQYTMGHLDRVEAIEAREALIPGLGIAGGCLRGVGVPNCFESGERAAEKVLGDLSAQRQHTP